MKKLRILAAALAVCVWLGVAAPVVAASPDSSPSTWAADEVAKASAAGLIPDLSGTPSYQDSITRKQFAELIVNFVEKVAGKTITPEAETTFTDETSIAVRKAAAAKIVNGVGDNKFAPNTKTDREQIASMIYRAITYIKKITGNDLAPKPGSYEEFTDKDTVSYWAIESVSVLAGNGIMNGVSATKLSPQAPCTIEQSILLVYRAYTIAQAVADGNGPEAVKFQGYADFPTIPDIGAMLGQTLKEDLSDLGKAIGYSAIYLYEFPPTAADGMAVLYNYGRVLSDSGFYYYYQNEATYCYRGIEDESLLVAYTIDINGLKVYINTAYETPEMPGSLSYYDTYPSVPDFGALTGKPLLSKTTDGHDIQYKYQYSDADPNFFSAYLDILLEHGFVLEGSSQIVGVKVFVSEDGSLRVSFGDNGNIWIVNISKS
jgi:hypothetical protein